MPIGNGGIIGKRNLPTPAAVSGVFTLAEVLDACQAGIWPGSQFPSVTYLGTDGSGNTSVTTRDWGSKSLGAASATRRIVVAVYGVDGGGAGRTITAVTVQGISATRLVEQNDARGPLGLFIADVPTGTTGNIVTTFSGACVSGACIGWWAINDLKSSTPVQTNKGSGTSTASADLSAPGEQSIVISAASSWANGTFSVAGLTLDFDTSSGEAGGSFRREAASGVATGSALTIAYSGGGTTTQAVAAALR